MNQAMNPYLPLWEYVPDAEPRVFGDRVYVYGSHDIAGSTKFCEGEYVVWSAPVTDLGNWTCHGPSYDYAQTGDNMDDGVTLYAPDCVQGPDGRYYLYYNPSTRSFCGVAVSDTPEGPFRFIGNVAYPDGTLPEGKCFDPGVLVDDDGRVYLYIGFCPTPNFPWAQFLPKYSLGFELESDMKTIKAGPFEILPGSQVSEGTGFEGHAYYEASSPRKIGGKYYMVYSSELSHELCYAVSDSPLGGYRYGGILVSNADLGLEGNTQPKMPYGNTHGGLVELLGKWYIFYHRQTHGIECCRQGCAEPIELDENGHFHQAEITSSGLNGKPLTDHGTYSAAYACNLLHESIGKERLTTRKIVRDEQPHIFEAVNAAGEKEQFLANMQSGTLAGFKYFTLETAEKVTVVLRADAPGTMEVFLDEACTIPAARIPFAACGGWNHFSAEFRAEKGVFPLFFRLNCAGRADWLNFTLE